MFSTDSNARRYNEALARRADAFQRMQAATNQRDLEEAKQDLLHWEGVRLRSALKSQPVPARYLPKKRRGTP